MNLNLYIVSVDLINGLYPIVLDVLSLIAIFAGILVITTKNPIVSVLFLIFLFLVIAVYLIFIGIHFIGLSYLLVYIGGISILFLFTVMLINIRVAELLSYTSNSLPLALIYSIILYYGLSASLAHINTLSSGFASSNSGLDINFSTSLK
jgi:NADH-ubiquinone oxidoreductase chain 6